MTKMRPKTTKPFQEAPQEGSKMVKMGPNMRPKMAKMRPKMPNMRLNRPKMAKMRAKMAKMRAKMPQMRPSLPALVVLEQLNIATVATVGFAESGVPAGCLRPFARFLL